MQLHQPVDIFLSHDWPLNIYEHGDKADLLARNPTFARDVSAGLLCKSFGVTHPSRTETALRLPLTTDHDGLGFPSVCVLAAAVSHTLPEQPLVDAQVNRGVLGSPPQEQLLHALKVGGLYLTS